jgi:acetyl-CoA acyltransferase
MTTTAVIADAVRTPIARGKPGGTLSCVHPADLLAETLVALMDRLDVDPAQIDDVIAGCVGQVGEQSNNIARGAVLGAGFPESVPGTTVDRQCGSSQQAAAFAAHAILAGANDAVIACGVESMSRVPMGTNTLGHNPAGQRMLARYPKQLVQQGVSAELIAAQWGLTRAELDEYSAESHRRAALAVERGDLTKQTLQLSLKGVDGSDVWLDRDEGIRPDTTVEQLATLEPAFVSPSHIGIEWKVTAGNSSQISDGASAALITSDDFARANGLRPRAAFRGSVAVGADPVLMLTAIIPATEKLLGGAGLTIEDIDCFEVNEAFASVVLAWQRETGADLERVNINGGAIAFGHPLGASGGRLLASLLDALEQRDGQFGVQIMCEAGGLANATLIERL